MTVYYNEHDAFAAAWLRNLIAENVIAPGDVDERSVIDVQPGDLAGYTQCHFFAGIGGWSYALRLAGWADDRPVWTGSCPCQPFSTAGKGEGIHDPRHLWPAWLRLLTECRPTVILGEQVASPAGVRWLDIVATDLEDLAYAVGAFDLPAACVESPIVRQRLWFVAEPEGERERGLHLQPRRPRPEDADAERLGQAGRVAGTEHAEWRKVGINDQDGCHGPNNRRQEAHGELGTRGEILEFGRTNRAGLEGRRALTEGPDGRLRRRTPEPASPLRPWANAEWIPCTDGVYRATEPGIFPMAAGIPNRMGTLRGSGNSIVPQVAAQFVGAYLDVLTERAS